LIATPAVDNLVARFLPSQSPHYVAPSHVSLFTHRAMTALLERHGFTIERMEIDEGVGILDRAAISLLYDLDFVSPRSDDDANDAWYRPNALGRLLGRRPSRALPVGPVRRALQFADWVIWRAARRLGCVPINDH